ncbi:hypothetical protein AB4097_08880 [Microvirga sp. 2MCAF35]|uniref:hypothetical protein n=1 Tax=Microvirga sp. 2MCAF35 TaxID=3232987 RepID=UPI003F9AED8E
MPASNPPFSRTTLVAYVEDMVSEALESGTVDPASGLECFLYAIDPKMVIALREFTALKPEIREEILNTARLLAADPNTDNDASDMTIMH